MAIGFDRAIIQAIGIDRRIDFHLVLSGESESVTMAASGGRRPP
jgi:hypothetical protein